ncbi:hypothetical protein BD324DRAFT_630838 [Kockovaella imperatae]|uniref:Uncharacterized protein n=1 Tax=Kockovaella imperatae TaxID=4999 RepID=A0A1Y1UC37_9TREE|nr:hypothetical protein BD324DRAFT_630838 [Kockovaella imperatae]ORX35610.1 hypothetical protein BD324DRAFT_630838 [Kockovaella imperatae]
MTAFWTGQTRPRWYEILQSYEFCHQTVKVTASGHCWIAGTELNCTDIGMSTNGVVLLGCIKPTSQILGMLSIFSCILVHLFNLAHEERWAKPAELKHYRPWILFSILLAAIAGTASLVSGSTLLLDITVPLQRADLVEVFIGSLIAVTALQEGGTCNHALRIG